MFYPFKFCIIWTFNLCQMGRNVRAPLLIWFSILIQYQWPIRIKCLSACAGSDAPFELNHIEWIILVRMCEFYQISDMPAFASSMLQDVGMITDDDKTYVIDRSKLGRDAFLLESGRKSRRTLNMLIHYGLMDPKTLHKLCSKDERINTLDQWNLSIVL